MAELNTMLSEIDPMVSLKLSDYEKIMKYIKLLEDAPSTDNPYKKAFEGFINRLNNDNREGSGYLPLEYSAGQFIIQRINQSLDNNNLKLERIGNLNNLLVKIVPK